MADALVEQIADDLVTDLSAIATPTYQNTVAAVKRPTRLGLAGVRLQDGMIILTQGVSARETDLDFPGSTAGVARLQTFLIYVILRPSDASTDPLDQVINSWVADVIKAVMTDPQRSSLAINSWIGGIEPIAHPSGEFAGVEVEYTVQLRTLENDYTTRA